MQGKDHNLILGILFLAECVLFLLMNVILLFVFIIQIVAVIKNNSSLETLLPVLVVYLLVLTLPTVIALVMGIASYKMLKNKSNARIWGVISSILTLPVLIPLGFLLGIYGICFLFSQTGKDFYQSINPNINNSIQQ